MSSTHTEHAAWCRDHGWQIIPLSDNRLRLLREIPDPPAALFVRGDADVLALPALAVVGARRASAYGLRAALRFAHGLCEQGLVVASGLARGIDSAAHRGALAAKGRTVAVLGHGPQMIYPRENAALADAIVEGGGCLVTEYAPGTEPRKHHFPARNRLLSGLCLGTLVVEAAAKSGSLITARIALDQNREVFAVPGGFDFDSFAGCHWLIQQGAKLVGSPEEILAELPPLEVSPHVSFSSSLDPRLGSLLDESGATLPDLFARWKGTFANLVEAIDRAKAEGLLLEWTPGFFVASGRALPNEKDLRTIRESRGP